RNCMNAYVPTPKSPKSSVRSKRKYAKPGPRELLKTAIALPLLWANSIAPTWKPELSSVHDYEAQATRIAVRTIGSPERSIAQRALPPPCPALMLEQLSASV